jgi:branched-subunit amino acid transport protein
MNRGFGSVTFLIIFVTGMISLGITKLAGLPVWAQELLWGIPAAVLNAILVAKYLRVEPPKFAIDQKTMENVQVTSPPRHVLFWIPVRFWTYIILGYTCVGMIQEFHLL